MFRQKLIVSDAIRKTTHVVNLNKTNIPGLNFRIPVSKISRGFIA